jgi:formylglycine-generating enzyme required for sulfatase activity
VDAGTPGEDVGPPGDAGPDVDGDEDGLVSSMDCDDADPTVGAMNVETCTSACGYGTVVCTNGTRTACSALTECGCPMPGEVRTLSCGRCGIASQTCGADNRWSMPSACTDERECMAGTVEVRASRCGREERVCDGMCGWRAWTEVVPLGECEPGETRGEQTAMCGAGAEEIRTCGEDCQFGEPEGCRPLCTRGPRSSRTGTATVCVPAGPFILGEPMSATASPPRTVTLSEYWVAVNPVTVADYTRCEMEGACTAVAVAEFLAGAPSDAATGLTHEQAVAFCEWDGGTIISEFQWEKAARGPAPSMLAHPWGDEPVTACLEICGEGCDWPPNVSELPGSYSPYRAHLMGNVYEWTSTHFRTGWTWLSDGAIDPASPPGDRYPTWVSRGSRLFGTLRTGSTVSPRAGLVGDEDFLGTRCVY